MDWITPMEPISTKTLLSGPEWIHQIKWDGIRGLTYYDSEPSGGGGNGLLRIFTKKGRERTAFYPELHRIKGLIRGRNAVLDGEMVVLGEDSKPEFQLSLVRERVGNPDRLAYYTRKFPVLYVLFDILYLDGQALTHLPFQQRMVILRNTVRSDANIAITDDFSEGRALFELMKKKNWEGIVSKKLDSPYLPAKNHKAWYKYKTMKKILTAVCGIQLKDNFPNSLIMGIRRVDEWIYVGKASLGLTQEDLKNLKEYLEIQNEGKCPFPSAVRQHGGDLSGAVTWLEPAITCWISFLEWTNDGVLRHPKILGFTSQKAEEADGREWSLDG
jgi:bifunctional non-homologous end joining protein LigD